MNKTIKALLFSSFATYQSVNAAVIYTQEFNGLGAFNSNLANLGGSFNNIDFDDEDFNGIVVASDVDFSNNTLLTDSNSDFRGVGIAISPAQFQSAGTFTINFDITSFDQNFNTNNTGGQGFGIVNVFSGSDFGGTPQNFVQFDSQSGLLTANGPTATVTSLASEQFTSTGTFSFDFEYDGTSVVGIFLGAQSVGFPFPAVEFDNLTISTAVPEPSTNLLLLGSSFLLLQRRNRKSK